MAGTAAGAAKRAEARAAQREAQREAEQSIHTATVQREIVYAAKEDPTTDMEVWEITTEGRVWVQMTSYTRNGQPILKDVSVGPKKPGGKLRISRADREMNQESVADTRHDPFVNGLLVRVDADQNLNPKTASTDALTTADLLAVYDLKGEAFRVEVEKLGQVPIRKLREMAEAVDATTSQIAILEEVIAERYRQASSQPDAVFDLSGQRRPEREGRE